MVRGLSFFLGAVALTLTLTLLTAAPGPWDESSGEDSPGDGPSGEERPPRADEPVELTSLLAPVVFSTQRAEGIPRGFYFTRAAYTGYRRGFGRGGGGGRWDTDYPKADQIFLSFIDRLVPHLDAYEWQHPMLLDDPELRRFPFLYALEVGAMALTEPEVVGLRDYLLSGGFLVIDDFWGTLQWINFEYEIQQVLPGYEIVDLTLDHPIFTTFYEIDEILQVPNVTNGVRGGPTHQRDGFVPMVKGIHDENGRLMVVINWNTDLGDAWEWADNPDYPFRYSSYAYEMGVNMIVYAMSH